MTGESFFALMCAALIAMLFGLAVCFLGYRFFIILLPIWGFFFGLAFGAQTMQALFGTGAFATVTSWVVGFLVGGVFAVLSYLFYAIAIAVIAGSLGYSLTVGILTGIGMNMNFLVWIIAMVVAVALIFVTFRFNLQRWVIIIATSVLGAATIAGTIGLMFSPAARVLENPIQVVLKASPLLAILGIVLAVAGIVVQARMTKFEIESYNRWEQPA
jgi:hypothetical protein